MEFSGKSFRNWLMGFPRVWREKRWRYSICVEAEIVAKERQQEHGRMVGGWVVW